jgi:hypothetical protein
MATPKENAPDLSFVDTNDLIDELRRRSKVFFCIARPLGQEAYSWRMHWGVEGGTDDHPEAMARTLGLIEIGKANLLSGNAGGEDE